MSTKRLIASVLPIVLLLALATACGAPSAPDIQVRDAWARPAMAMGGMGETQPSGMAAAGTGAVFMRLVNDGREADRLLGGQTAVAEVVEIHETVMEGEVMKMRMLAGGLEVPAGGEVLLQPGGYHVMLIGMKQELKPGDTLTLDLQFEKSGTLTIEAQVREP